MEKSLICCKSNVVIAADDLSEINLFVTEFNSAVLYQNLLQNVVK